MWVKKISASAKLIPYRIICRCVPSPQSNISVSPSRITAIDETLRSTVGRDAEVPRKRRVSDMRAKYIVALQAKGNAVCLSPAHQIINETERDDGNENREEIFRSHGAGKREK